MRRIFILIAVLMSALATGCANLAAPPYAADFSAVDALKRTSSNKVAVGKVLPDDPKAKVNSISLRAANLSAGDTSFAGYLERAMSSDLREAGLLDSKSNVKIELVLLQNDIDISGFSEGKGLMEVDLSITSSGQSLLRKTYTATTKFESSFMGSTAIAKGQSEYPNLVRALLASIYRDPAFLKAVASK